ncbi:essential MCU regulator, mitochondrial [Anabrus simplex]|uniref:essential MCU regulator, mitochondrial n=1 Tax=Anabrus simplex TaxID=316456 RepID=UPI0034DD6547
MSASRLRLLWGNSRLLDNERKCVNNNCRQATTTPTGAVLPEPSKTPFGLVGLVLAVVPGLLIGATISKRIANFLEENDLFVPSDDDDDDD